MRVYDDDVRFPTGRLGRHVREERSIRTEDEDEILSIRWVSASTVLDLFRSGLVEDGFTLSAWMLASCLESDFAEDQTV